MVSRNTTLVPSLGLRIGPACEAGLSAGMRRERVPAQIRKKKERNSKTVQDRAIVTMTDQLKVIHGLSNRAIFNDLE